jgi:hypothetical protein
VTLASTAVFTYAGILPAGIYGYLWWASQGAGSLAISFLELVCVSLRVRIDLIRIRIQHFCSIRIQFRIRIQAKTELSKTISFSNFFEIKIWVKSNQKYRCYSSKFISKSSAILYIFSGKIKKITKKCIFHWNFFIFLPLDPDLDSQDGSGSTKSLNPDPFRILIRIYNPGKPSSFMTRIKTTKFHAISSRCFFFVTNNNVGTLPVYKNILFYDIQCCGCGSGIRCFYTPWIRDKKRVVCGIKHSESGIKHPNTDGMVC